MSLFHLSKWYLDCVTEDGSALIGYWARLRWRALALEYAAALFAPAGEEPRQVHLLRSPPSPVLNGAECSWHCDPLGLSGRWVAEEPPVKLDLLQTAAGGIRWSLHQPRARAQIKFQEAGALGSRVAEMSGLGYVEELELTIPPWRLPFDHLLWGRFLSPEHSLVWIQWEQSDSPEPSRRRFALLNGALEEEPVITPDGVDLPGRGGALSFRSPRPLREGHLAGTVFDAIPGLTGLLPPRFRRAHESKRLSPADLQLPENASTEGWSIYEVVQW